MPSIRIYGRSEVFPCNLTTTILNTLMKNGYPIATVCGGRAACGKDVIRIREGLQFTSPRREMELRRLAALAGAGEPAGEDIRLACQTYVRGDVVIEVFHVWKDGEAAVGSS